MHFSTQFSSTTLGLLWGYPFFVRGEGQSTATAGLLLTIMVVAVMSAGPVLGWRITVRPWHRSTLVLGDRRRDRDGLDGRAELARATRRCGCWWCWSWSPASAARRR